MNSVSDLVSTIIPVFNRSGMLREAVDSVLAQTHRPIEIILVDDGSTDETAAVCDELAAAHPEIRVLHQANAGPGAAREAGRLLAAGAFLQYLDSDDLLLPRKTDVELKALKDHPEADVAFCAIRHRFFDRPDEKKASRWDGETVTRMLPALLKGRIWLTPAFLVRKGVSDRCGPWSNLRQYEDWEYDVRVAARGGLAVWCPETLAEVRHHALPRAGAWERVTPEQLRDRARAHALIYRVARDAGIGSDVEEMRHLARALFSYARWCGAAGFSEDSRELFDLAREASGRSRSRGLDFRFYRSLAALVGWRSAGRLSTFADRLRP